VQPIDDEVEAGRLRFLSSALLAERSGAADVAAELLAGGADPRRLITELLAPVQQLVGERWAEARCSVGQEHAVTAVSDAVLSTLTVGFEPAPWREHAVVVCAEGEVHSLPGRMAAELLLLDGFRVTYLGAPLSAGHLARVLADLDADLVAVSCTRVANLPGAARSLAAARALGFDTAVGGGAIAGDRRRAATLGATVWLELGEGLRPLPQAGSLDLVTWEPLELAAGTLAGSAVATLSARGLVDADAFRREEVQASIEDGVRVVAAAGMVGEPQLVDEHAGWMTRMFAAHGYPPALVPAIWEVLARAGERAGRAVSGLFARGAVAALGAPS
jgi:methanogenic corrinoid protein MtbC1